MSKQGVQISGENVFQGEARASVKILRWEHARGFKDQQGTETSGMTWAGLWGGAVRGEKVREAVENQSM